MARLRSSSTPTSQAGSSAELARAGRDLSSRNAQTNASRIVNICDNWKIERHTLEDFFDEENICSYRFIEALYKVSKKHPFEQVKRALQDAQDTRLNFVHGRKGLSKQRLWTPADVLTASASLDAASTLITLAPRVANEKLRTLTTTTTTTTLKGAAIIEDQEGEDSEGGDLDGGNIEETHLGGSDNTAITGGRKVSAGSADRKSTSSKHQMQLAGRFGKRRKLNAKSRELSTPVPGPEHDIEKGRAVRSIAPTSPSIDEENSLIGYTFVSIGNSVDKEELIVKEPSIFEEQVALPNISSPVHTFSVSDCSPERDPEDEREDEHIDIEVPQLFETPYKLHEGDASSGQHNFDLGTIFETTETTDHTVDTPKAPIAPRESLAETTEYIMSTPEAHTAPRQSLQAGGAGLANTTQVSPRCTTEPREEHEPSDSTSEQAKSTALNITSSPGAVQLAEEPDDSLDEDSPQLSLLDEILSDSIKRLAPKTWLNDELVRAAIDTFQHGSFRTFSPAVVFDDVGKMRENVKPEKLVNKVLVLPLSQYKTHFTLCTVNVPAHVVDYLNSMADEQSYLEDARRRIIAWLKIHVPDVDNGAWNFRPLVGTFQFSSST